MAAARLFYRCIETAHPNYKQSQDIGQLRVEAGKVGRWKKREFVATSVGM